MAADPVHQTQEAQLPPAPIVGSDPLSTLKPNALGNPNQEKAKELQDKVNCKETSIEPRIVQSANLCMQKVIARTTLTGNPTATGEKGTCSIPLTAPLHCIPTSRSSRLN